MTKLNEMGQPIAGDAKRVERTPESERVFGWRLTEDAKKEIQEIEANARASEQRTASIVLC